MSDVTQLEVAARAGDFEGVSAALGVQLDAAAFEKLAGLCRYHGMQITPALVFTVIRRALTDVTGIAHECVDLRSKKWFHVLVVRRGANVTVGLKLELFSKKLSKAWPVLEGWKPKLENNTALADAWSTILIGENELRLSVRSDFRAPRDESDQRREFIDAIVRSPDDDHLRLVYADWLTERGDAQGELIRLQTDQRLEGSDRDARARKILDANWMEFAGELKPWCSPGFFKRGFVSRVSMTPAAFEKHGERIFSKHPVEQLDIDAPRFSANQFEQIISSPALSRVKHLVLAQDITQFPIRRLALARFDSLRELELKGCGSSGEDWEALFETLEAPQLETLRLQSTATHPALWRALAKGRFPKLKAVFESAEARLPAENFNEELATAFSAFAQAMPQLETLHLGSKSYVEASLLPLFDSSSRLQLRTLSLYRARLTNETLRVLQRGGRLDALRYFSTELSEMTFEGLAAFFDSGCASKLETFSLLAKQRTFPIESGIHVLYEALMRSPSLKGVSVPETHYTDEVWKRLRVQLP